MSAESITADRGSRRRISSSLDEGLFIEAGAGTGKTT
jgi:ATP-dependent exoDNAse (exonuclease V) beta subunit